MKEDTERTPLRTILTNFLNHIDTLENQRTPDNTYESEFQELKQFSESIKGTKQYSCSEGEKEVNRKKNRYKDILPFDGSRVVLNEYAGVPGSDYINANFIKGASGSPAYIACQGPLPHTVNDFWRMVVQCEVQVIVMACNEEEAGKHKCENYWVSEEGEEKQFGMVSLRLLKASTVCPDFSVRTMRLKYTNTQANTEERTVCQFHYSAWPDHGVPPLVRPLLDMVRLVRDTQASETLPVLIHCSAGCGRTGTICAIDYVWGLLRAGKLTKDFSLLLLVREMRKQRIAMVQTKEQYVLVHRAVRELFREQLRMIDSHPYENIDCNGLPLIKCPSPEPTYDNISSFQNNKAEEKQDEKEKEQAPPLPQKKRFQTLSSKQAKEVENLSERQRQLEQAGSSSESVTSTASSGTRPRIAALRSLFERQHASRDSRQVARSHSLGSVRPPQQTNSAEGKALPIPGRGILRVPQAQPRPALPVKRSKSLRVLGSSDRCKLSIPPAPPPGEGEAQRRLSLESNYEEMKDLVESGAGHHLSDYLSVDSIVAGLGVRERSNSFRRAVANETLMTRPAKPGQLMRSYTSVDMRSSRERPHDTQTKPLLRPKPNLRLDQSASRVASDIKKLSSDLKSNVRNLPHTPTTQQFSALSELKKSQLHPSSSRTLTTHSVSLRLAPKPRREDCRILVSQAGGSSNLSYSSGESTVSTSSEQGGNKSSISKKAGNTQLLPERSVDMIALEKTKQMTPQARQYQNVATPKKTDILNPAFRQDRMGYISPREQRQFIKQQISHSTPPGRPEQSNQPLYQKINAPPDGKKNVYSQNLRHLVYDSKGLPQNAAVYGTVNKPTPPPYVEPGKNAQKPRSSPHSLGDKQPPLTGHYSEVYGKLQDQRHWMPSYSSRDMVLAHSSHSKPSTTNDRSPASDPSGATYSTNYSDRRTKEESYMSPPKKPNERRHELQEQRVLPQDANERRYQQLQQESHLRNERRQLEQEPHRTGKNMGSKTPMEKRPKEQFRQNSSNLYSKSFNDRKPFDRNAHISSHETHIKSALDRREHDFPPQQVIEGYRPSTQETFSKSEDIRLPDQDFRLNPPDKNSSSNTKISVNPEMRGSTNEQHVNPAERRTPYNYQPGQRPGERRGLEQEFQQLRPRMGQVHDFQQNPRVGPSDPSSSSDTATPPNQGLKMRRGSRDDLALCATTPSRVKRHASVVLLRHSLIEGSTPAPGDPNASPLSIWSQANSAGDPAATVTKEDPWSGAVGVDLDQVAASISTQKDGKMMRAALEALHLRKSTPKSTPTSHKVSQPPAKPTPPAKVSQPTPMHTADPGKVPQEAPPKPGPFRKQQQYL